MDIGKIIKEERISRNLTQEQFAQKFFVTRQLVSKWEHGKSYPDLDQVVKMSEWFDLSLDYLLKEDTRIIEELTFDTKLKRALKRGALFFSFIFLGVLLATGLFIVLISQPLLYASDIEILQVEKITLPEEQLIHPITKETWTLPEDVEYRIHFKTNKPFTDLTKYTGFVNIKNEQGIQILLGGGHWKLIGGKKESIMYIPSDRADIFQSNLNIGKNIYLMNNHTTENQTIDQLENWSDKILDWKELDKLPTTKSSETPNIQL